MKLLSTIVRTAIGDLYRNKIRTLLTSLGILIGVLSVVLLIAFGLGLKNYIQGQFDSLGANLMYVLPGRVFSEGGGFQDPGELGAQFDDKDVQKISRISNVNLVVPVYEKGVTITGGSKSIAGQILATTPDVASVLNLEIESGEFFTKSDNDKRAKKVVIGPKLAEELFGGTERALGKKLRISETSYTVTGVLKPKGGGGLGGPSFDSIAYLPFKSTSRLNPDMKYLNLYVQADTKETIGNVKLDVEKELLKRYTKDDFSVVEQTEILNTVSSIFAILNSILVAIGSISLIVGGIGIMNIMYATVTERIKEVGIRRALGATKKDILLQFLSQAVLLSLFGGVLGLVLSILIVYGIRFYFPAEISIFSIVVALSVSTGIGVFFGVFPAVKAANLSPIEAIRYE